MLHVLDEKTAGLLWKGKFGIELESHRVTGEGLLASTPDPFGEHPNIVRDYSEDQLEINTDPAVNADSVMEQLREHLSEVDRVLAAMNPPEYRWPFSNPPLLRGPGDIKTAVFTGDDSEGMEYREYLARRYGRYLMTFSGIHFNYSFADELLQREYELEPGHTDKQEDYEKFKSRFYLELAEKTLDHIWLVVALLSASPVLDSSFYEKGGEHETVFSGMASLRCSEQGYWNHFTPVLNYDDMDSYEASIRRYVEEGLLAAARELYYPVRVKPRGKYSLEALSGGVSHIEIRSVDLNPLSPDGVDSRDIVFLQLLLIWLASKPRHRLTGAEQVDAVKNIKRAARYDMDLMSLSLTDGFEGSVRDAVRHVLDEMKEFYSHMEISPEDPDAPDVAAVLEHQYAKIESEEVRYAAVVKKLYGDDFLGKGLALAKERQI